MSDTPTKNVPAPLPVGGTVMAIVPQTFEEIQRVANSVIAAGIAPANIVKTPRDDDTAEQKKLIQMGNVAAVSAIIMAGAELGLPAMVSLRVFTFINKRPALYADGNVAVVRKARDREGHLICKALRTGFTEFHDVTCPVCKSVFRDESDAMTHMLIEHFDTWDRFVNAHQKLVFPRVEELSDRSFAWCDAVRADTGETFIEQFSIADAKKAKLWDDREKVEAEVWAYDEDAKKRKPHKEQVDNPAPWHRFPKRMLMWRATGYCLRWLFADALGGMPDEYEARDIENMVDITPTEPTRPRSGQKTDLPDIDLPGTEPDPSTSRDQKSSGGGNKPDSAAALEVPGDIDQTGTTDAEDDQDAGFVPEGEITPAIEEALLKIADVLDTPDTEAEIEEQFDAFDVQTKFAGNTAAIGRAFQIKADAINRLAIAKRAELEEAGQTDIFGGQLPEVPQ